MVEADLDAGWSVAAIRDEWNRERHTSYQGVFATPITAAMSSTISAGREHQLIWRLVLLAVLGVWGVNVSRAQRSSWLTQSAAANSSNAPA
jgi:hypothetical protein